MTEPPRDASRRKPAIPATARATAPKARHVSIGDLAREFDVTPRTIRFYEARGLLRPGRSGLIRQFGPEDRQRLGLILRARNLGLSLFEIAEQLALYDSATAPTAPHCGLQERLRSHIAALREKQSALGALLEELEAIESSLARRIRRHAVRRSRN